MPKGVFGFVYKITNTKTGQYYIGKKQVVSVRKRKFGKREIASLEDKRMKKYEMIQKESDWKTYRSSNQIVKDWFSNEKISSVCILEILRFCSNKKSLTYYELQEQFSHDVLSDELSLNENLLGKFYPKDVLNKGY